MHIDRQKENHTDMVEYYTKVKRRSPDNHNGSHLLNAHSEATRQISVLLLLISSPPPCSSVANACLRTQEGFSGNLHQQ